MLYGAGLDYLFAIAPRRPENRGRGLAGAHHMNLHHLKIFCTVAQRSSITAAAADLLLSQPAVSLQLKALERELGMPLFQRGGAKLRLTQAGEVLVSQTPSVQHRDALELHAPQAHTNPQVQSPERWMETPRRLRSERPGIASPEFAVR